MAVIYRGSLLAGDWGELHTVCIGELATVITRYALEDLFEITYSHFSLDLIKDVDGAH